MYFIKNLLSVIAAFIALSGCCLIPDASVSSKNTVLQKEQINSLLISAVRDGNNTRVTELLQKGGDPNILGIAVYTTPLPLFSWNENREAILQQLINAGADVEYKRDDGVTALNSAAIIGNSRAISILLEHGANPNSSNESNQWTPLHNLILAGSSDERAIEDRMAPSAKSLFAFGANANLLNSQGYSPLSMFILEYSKNGNFNTEILDVLLANGSDPNIVTKNATTAPLLHASFFGNAKIVSKLLEYKANPNLKSGDFKQSALMSTVYNNHIDTAKLLLRSGANPNLASGVWPHLNSVHMASVSGSIDILELMLDEGGEINLANSKGNTPLHLSAYNGNAAKVRLLLNYGANRSLTNTRGFSALDYAMERGHVDIVSLLASDDITNRD